MTVDDGAGKRGSLLRAARHHFAEAGVDATSLEEIRQDARASTGSLYHHFPSKAHLVGAVYLETLRRYQEAFLRELVERVTAEDGIRGIVEFHLRWCVDHADHARLLFRERVPGPDSPVWEQLREANGRFLGQVTAWWRPHVHYGVLRELPGREVYVLWLGPAQELCRLWLAGASPELPTESAGLLGGAAWLSLRAPDHPDGQAAN